MNSSAKKTTLSFLAAAALGAVVFMGCSVSSGTVDDTDGGTQNNDKDAGNNNNNDSGQQSETGTGDKCESTQPETAKFKPEACQTCLEKSCCLEIKNCFSLPGDADNGKLDCAGFKDCLDDCSAKPAGQEQDDCIKECTDTLAAAGVVDAWQSLTACTDQSCATECAAE